MQFLFFGSIPTPWGAKYDFDSVVNMMKDEWKKLDDRFDVKFDIHSETVQFEERYASYSVREFDIYNPNTFEVI